MDATATDNCGIQGNVTGTRSDNLPLTDPYPVGTTIITWSVADVNGNDAVDVQQEITITDDELPVISAQANITQTADAGLCTAIVSIVDATATDNCGIQGNVTGTRSDNLPLTDPYPVGTTIITWSVADVNGNDAVNVQQEITITDDELPVISAQANITQTLMQVYAHR